MDRMTTLHGKDDGNNTRNESNCDNFKNHIFFILEMKYKKFF